MRKSYAVNILTFLVVSFPFMLLVVTQSYFPVRTVCLVGGLAPFVFTNPTIQHYAPHIFYKVVLPVVDYEWRRGMVWVENAKARTRWRREELIRKAQEAREKMREIREDSNSPDGKKSKSKAATRHLLRAIHFLFYLSKFALSLFLPATYVALSTTLPATLASTLSSSFSLSLSKILSSLLGTLMPASLPTISPIKLAKLVVQRLLDDDRLSDECWNSEMREVELWENERWVSNGPAGSAPPPNVGSENAGGQFQICAVFFFFFF